MGNRLAILARGLDGVGRDGKLRPTETFLRRLVSGGSGAASPGRNRPDITFQGTSFEARYVWSRNGRAISRWVDGTFHLRNKCARAVGARIGGSWHFEFFLPGEWATVALPPSWPSSQGAWSWRAPSIKAAAGGLVSFLSLLRHKSPCLQPFLLPPSSPHLPLRRSFFSQSHGRC